MSEHDIENSEANYRVKAMLSDNLTKNGLTVQEAAARLNIPGFRLYKYLDPRLPNPFPAYLLPMWALRIDPEPLEEICKEAHRATSELPRIHPDWSDTTDLTDLKAQIMEESVMVLNLLTPDMTLRQYKEIRRAAQLMISTMLSVDRTAEHMARVVPKPRSA